MSTESNDCQCNIPDHVANTGLSVATKKDVPDFEPVSLNSGEHGAAGGRLGELLLSKLVAAELACYKSDVFLGLEQRTRLTMLSQVAPPARTIGQTQRV